MNHLIPRQATPGTNPGGTPAILLHFDGANNSTSIIDVMGNTVVRNGNPYISTTQSKFGGSSCYFNSTSYLEINGATAFGTGDFTLDFWVYFTATGTYMFNSRLNETADDYGFDLGTNGSITTSDVDQMGATSEPLNEWIHIALVRHNGTLIRYYNGVSNGTCTTLPSTMISTQYQIGGSTHANTGYMQGYMDEFCVTPGYARWTANFTPPTEPYSV